MINKTVQAYVRVVQTEMILILSDEVEHGLLLFEAAVNDRWCPSFTSALTNKSCQPMSVANARWLFDRSRNIVIGVAELVGEQLNLVWSFFDIVVEDCELGWGSHTLLGCNGNKVEFVSALINDGGVDDCASCGIRESADSTSEDSSVNAFTCVDVHELAVSLTCRLKSSFDLLNLRNTDALDLAFTNTVTVENETCWVGCIIFLESFKSALHT